MTMQQMNYKHTSNQCDQRQLRYSRSNLISVSVCVCVCVTVMHGSTSNSYIFHSARNSYIGK